ncbi:uncharacterized protein LOC115047450 isoform X1 [Echeneis naucrates]|uniref:uncharacterized protein LOC115047450 isoform X1 n=1 Tax=Echeneis naucrates TaxID=173247 RepID=UPI001113CADC|nr:uncharacterized protein LOC115047450 isoform X1 [Echeneis naucrates]
MSCEGNGISDERIGEALIKEVIEEELRDAVSEDVPPLTPLTTEVRSEQEEMIVNQLSKMIRIIGDRVHGDKAFQDAIDGVAQDPNSKWEKFKKVSDKVLEQGITWERIAVLFYVAGKLAVKFVEAHLPQSVREILMWTVDFFKRNLLGWIREHGGWSQLTLGEGGVTLDRSPVHRRTNIQRVKMEEPLTVTLFLLGATIPLCCLLLVMYGNMLVYVVCLLLGCIFFVFCFLFFCACVCFSS